jgi:hypothetical protein
MALLGAHHILHVSRMGVKEYKEDKNYMSALLLIFILSYDSSNIVSVL